MPRPAYFATKRALDILFSFGILLFSLPILVIAALTVKFSSPGPVLYRASRVGQFGQVFHMLKFRSMVMDADKVGPVITAGDDPRITPVGRFLRRSKIDELPQFWNVLMGHMSVVGPRPNVPSLVADYDDEAREILAVPQGITDYASLWFRQQEQMLENTDDVMADYETRVAPVKIRLARRYAGEMSLASDAKIFIATVLAVSLRRNVDWVFPEAIESETPQPKAA